MGSLIIMLLVQYIKGPDCHSHPGKFSWFLAGKLGRLTAILLRQNPLMGYHKMEIMKRILALALLLSLLYSCNRSVTPYQAASNHYSRCREMR